jgi:hypothetical protein
MNCSLFEFTLAPNSALPFRKLLVFESLLGISETFLCSMSAVLVKIPSARCTSTANVVCRDVDVFGTKTVSLIYIL